MFAATARHSCSIARTITEIFAETFTELATMDRTYIKDQNIVQRYLSGDLSLREAREFEKFCLENPDILESLPIPVRLKARLARHPMDDSDLQAGLATSSIDISDDDDDDDDTGSPSRWQSGSGGSRTAMVLGIALIASLAGIVVLLLAQSTQQKETQKALREAKATQLQPPGSIQPFRTVLNESKPSAPTLNVGAPNPARFIDLTVDVSKETYNLYLITIDDVTRGRVMQIRRVARDSNRELRITLNSSAFGTGDYDLQFEGYTWRGETVPVGWVRLGIK
jgi:hypothetical protein